ncbi:hypothetical protein BGX34_006379 [Mortierella sp. NVP85]|nr:hypothetical protein BGX34_006379 [Mortierella sp. NVP85]
MSPEVEDYAGPSEEVLGSTDTTLLGNPHSLGSEASSYEGPDRDDEFSDPDSSHEPYLDPAERDEQVVAQLRSVLGSNVSLLLERNTEARPPINMDPFSRSAEGGTVLPLGRRRIPVAPERAAEHDRSIDPEPSLLNPWAHSRTSRKVQAKASVGVGLLPDETDDSDSDSIPVPDEVVLVDTGVCGTVVPAKDIHDEPSEATEARPVVESPLPVVSEAVGIADDKLPKAFSLGGDGQVQFNEDNCQAEPSDASQVREESADLDSRSQIRAAGKETFLGMAQECQLLIQRRIMRTSRSFKRQKTIAVSDDERISHLLEAIPQLASDLDLENEFECILQSRKRKAPAY